MGAFPPQVTPHTISAVPLCRVVEIRYTHASLNAAATDALLIGSTLVSYARFKSLPSSLASRPTAGHPKLNNPIYPSPTVKASFERILASAVSSSLYIGLLLPLVLRW